MLWVILKRGLCDKELVLFVNSYFGSRFFFLDNVLDDSSFS